MKQAIFLLAVGVLGGEDVGVRGTKIGVISPVAGGCAVVAGSSKSSWSRRLDAGVGAKWREVAMLGDMGMISMMSLAVVRGDGGGERASLLSSLRCTTRASSVRSLRPEAGETASHIDP